MEKEKCTSPIVGFETDYSSPKLYTESYVLELETRLKKQKEVIDKLSEIIYEINDLKETTGGYPSHYVDDLLEILQDKEV